MRRNGLHQRSASLCAKKQENTMERSKIEGRQTMNSRFSRDVNLIYMEKIAELSTAGKHKLNFPTSFPRKDFCTHKITLNGEVSRWLKMTLSVLKWNFPDNRQGTKHKKILTSAIDSRS